jgi:hypothetical protein
MPTFGIVVDVPASLTPPEQISSKLDVPREWKSWDELFQTIRDTINDFIDVANKVPGIELQQLPGGSLADLVIKPFTGDWDRIRMNGEACTILKKGVQGLSKNTLAIPIDMSPHWTGRAAVAFSAVATVFGVVLDSVANVMAKGELVYAKVGRVCQRIGETAIKVIVALGKLLGRLAGKIAQRFAHWLAWVKTAADVIANGLEPVRDIYNGVRRVIDLVDHIFEMKARVEEYVDRMTQAFEVFTDIPAVVDELPTLGQIVLKDAHAPSKDEAEAGAAEATESIDPVPATDAADDDLDRELHDAGRSADEAEAGR